MTSTHGMLFPPLEDEVSRGNSETKVVLPAKLQDRFATIRALARLQSSSQLGTEQAKQLKHKQREAAEEAAKSVHDEVTRLENGIAELEAIYAKRQRRLHLQQFLEDDQDGDDELYSDEEDDGHYLGIGDDNNNALVLPALPAVIPAAEEPESEPYVADQANDNDDSQPNVPSDALATTEKAESTTN